mmetsp:Transcript_12011/g.24132  ORF Transcript_12011/g.24132 Transcript_12011/m.24132 type:complete len:166 (+) Transcript_12011:152-649(+)
MMSAEGSDAKEKLTDMEEDPKKTGQWWEEKPDLEDRTKKEVKQWLQHFKQENELDFNVDDVACRGKLLAARTEAQLKDIAGKIAGIDIFNAKEELKKKAMETEESGGAKLTENPAGGDYAKALVEAEKREAGDAKISKFLPMVLLTVCTSFIPVSPNLWSKKREV